MGWHDPPDDLDLSNPLWEMALMLWNRPGFASACLEAQYRGVVVLHILVALYSARAGFLWQGEEPRDIRQWRCSATGTLRSLRQQLARDNPATAALREKIKENEIASEQIELAWWWHYLGTMATWQFRNDLHPLDRSRHNLDAIGLEGDPAGIRERILDIWKQAPDKHSLTGNRSCRQH